METLELTPCFVRFILRHSPPAGRTPESAWHAAWEGVLRGEVRRHTHTAVTAACLMDDTQVPLPPSPPSHHTTPRQLDHAGEVLEAVGVSPEAGAASYRAAPTAAGMWFWPSHQVGQADILCLAACLPAWLDLA